VILTALLALAAIQAEPIKCKIGPIDHSFGGTEWQVFACDDGRSVLAVTKAGNPAAPFHFILAATDIGHEVYGEGSGDKAASDAAYADLQKLDEAAIAKLYAEATAAAPKP
jgi:hypothetical protein